MRTDTEKGVAQVLQQKEMTPKSSKPKRAMPPRADAKAGLKSVGYSCRQIDALLRKGWRGLVSEAEAELAEVLEAQEKRGKAQEQALEHLRAVVKGVK